jgi:hypothetical protein
MERIGEQTVQMGAQKAKLLLEIYYLIKQIQLK